MLHYACEWCKRTRKNGERWIVGLAAEKIGAISTQYEIDIIAGWSEKWARHPLAVHFCSEEHKTNFVRALFHVGSAPAEQNRRTKAATSAKPLLASRGSAPSGSQAGLAGLAITERARRSPTEPAAKRVAGQRAQCTFDVPDTVRAHGLSVRVDDPPIVALPPGDDLGEGYGGV